MINNLVASVTNTLGAVDMGVKVPTSISHFSIDSFLSNQPRGLTNFIAEIRSCKNKTEEQTRVDAELGNIRAKFSETSKLSSYQRKKYIWKLCYIYMLGYEIDFGHVEFISLMASTKYSEKSVGYMAISLMIRTDDDLMTLVVNSIRNDIIGPVDFGKSLGLSAVANLGGKDLAESLSGDVLRLLKNEDELFNKHMVGENADLDYSRRVKEGLTKKCIMCFLRLYRSNPDIVDKAAMEDSMVGIISGF